MQGREAGDQARRYFSVSEKREGWSRKTTADRATGEPLTDLSQQQEDVIKMGGRG